MCAWLAVTCTVVACSGTPKRAAPLARAPGFDGAEITVGSIAPFSGPTASLATSTLAGNQVYWDQLNAKGGIAGRYPVRVKRADGEFFESVAALRYDEVQGGIALVAQSFDTKATKAILPRLARDNLIAFPASDAPEWLSEPRLIPIGAPAEVRAINAISYWVDHGGRGHRLCALHQDGTYGPLGFDGVTFAADKLQLTLAAQPTFAPFETDLSRQVEELRQAQCEAVYFNGLGYQAVSAINKAQAVGFAPQWIGSASSWDPSLAALAGTSEYLRAHYWVVGNGPTPGDATVPAMRQLVAAQRRFAPEQKPDAAFVAGYVQSDAVRQVLEEAVKRGDLSRSGILRASQHVGTLHFDGLYPDTVLGSGPSARRPPRATSVFRVDPSSPGGLVLVQGDITSETARQFVVTR